MLLIVAGMEEKPASQVTHEARELVRNNNLHFVEYGLEPEGMFEALRIHREVTCDFARRLQEEWQREQQWEKTRRFRRRILNGLGGAAMVAVNGALGAGLLVGTAGTAGIAAAPLAAVSGAVGGALIASFKCHPRIFRERKAVCSRCLRSRCPRSIRGCRRQRCRTGRGCRPPGSRYPGSPRCSQRWPLT